MINVNREERIPDSLSRPEIRSYLNDLADYFNNPTNVNKPEPPVSYRSSDLLEAFDRIFHSKCYLTEEKFGNSGIMDVEHFVSKTENPTLVYEWSNLFPAAHYINMIKPRKTPNGGYLNPCLIEDDVESQIIYVLDSYGENPNFEPRYPENTKAKNTCELLRRLHNGHNSNTEYGTVSLRLAIKKKYIDILNKIAELNSINIDPQTKKQVELQLKLMLSRKSAFTMLCRSMPAVINSVPKDFLD